MGRDHAENGNYWYIEIPITCIRHIVMCVIANWPVVERRGERGHLTTPHRSQISWVGVGGHMGMATLMRCPHLPLCFSYSCQDSFAAMYFDSFCKQCIRMLVNYFVQIHSCMCANSLTLIFAFLLHLQYLACEVVLEMTILY